MQGVGEGLLGVRRKGVRQNSEDSSLKLKVPLLQNISGHTKDAVFGHIDVGDNPVLQAMPFATHAHIRACFNKN